jgi:uracil phosphoribosyltransferase
MEKVTPFKPMSQTAPLSYAEARALVHVAEHPLVGVRLTTLRDRRTPPAIFRRCLREISIALVLQALRDMPVREIPLETPMGSTTGTEPERPLALFPILRAGLGFAEAMLEFLPEARVGHIGMVRDPQTHQPDSYYFKTPPQLAESTVLLVDPMLATGGSAVASVQKLKEAGARHIAFVGLVGCPQGVFALHQAHPDVAIHLAALDPSLDENRYIVPGLGDAGDRYFGTL